MTNSQLMQQAKDCYKHIEEIGEILSKECRKEIQPLIDEGKFKEAKKAVQIFFKPAVMDDHCVLIEKDLTIFAINSLMHKNNE